MHKSKGLFVSAVIVAAGRGTRMNINVNKQYIDVCGKPVLARTIQIFEDCSLVDEVVLVVSENEVEYCKERIVGRYSFRKVKKLVTGGEKRQESVFNGLVQVDHECDIVLIHDGARPFLSEETLIESIRAAHMFEAACVAVPIKDTVKRTDKEGFVCETLDRDMLWYVQTPQAFKYRLIMEAHRKALEEGFMGTDDAVLVERMGIRLKLVMGRYDNIKITTQEDLAVAESIARLRDSI